MRTQFGTVVAAVCGIGGAAILSLPLAALADETPLAETASPLVYSADTLGSPRHIKTAGDQSALWPATRCAGETVTLVSPNGVRTTLISADSAAMSAALTLNAGGVWTVENSVQGIATFTVRHSLYGTQGAGTDSSPANLVDGDELIDLGAGAGYVFRLEPVDGLLGELKIPSGFRLDMADGGKWRILTSTDGCLYVGTDTVYPADSKATGPDRATTKKTALPVAYSGDDWVRDMSKTATLTITSPDGTETIAEHTGTGAEPFRFGKLGEWTVQLAMADGTTRTAIVTINPDAGFILTFK